MGPIAIIVSLVICLALLGGAFYIVARPGFSLTERSTPLPPPPSDVLPLAPGPDNTITTPPARPAPETPAQPDGGSPNQADEISPQAPAL